MCLTIMYDVTQVSDEASLNIRVENVSDDKICTKHDARTPNMPMLPIGP